MKNYNRRKARQTGWHRVDVDHCSDYLKVWCQRHESKGKFSVRFVGRCFVFERQEDAVAFRNMYEKEKMINILSRSAGVQRTWPFDTSGSMKP